MIDPMEKELSDAREELAEAQKQLADTRHQLEVAKLLQPDSLLRAATILARDTVSDPLIMRLTRADNGKTVLTMPLMQGLADTLRDYLLMELRAEAQRHVNIMYAVNNEA